MNKEYPVFEYLKKYLEGNLDESFQIHMKYPTAISQTLKIEIDTVKLGEAIVKIDANSKIHGNQQGTIHGGLLCELADAAIGTAHSTLMKKNESFTSVELKINFYRPVWESLLKAHAKPIRSGKTLTHYECTIYDNENKKIAYITSTVMTLRGADAKGR